MTPGDGGGGNRRSVSNVQLQAEIRHISELLTDLRDQWRKTDERVRDLAEWKSGMTEVIGNLKNEVDDVKRKSNRWDGVNSALAALAALIGGIGLNK